MMGKRKLRFDARKNYERKKYSRNASVKVAVESEVKLEELKISLPYPCIMRLQCLTFQFFMIICNVLVC